MCIFYMSTERDGKINPPAQVAKANWKTFAFLESVKF